MSQAMSVDDAKIDTADSTVVTPTKEAIIQAQIQKLQNDLTQLREENEQADRRKAGFAGKPVYVVTRTSVKNTATGKGGSNVEVKEYASDTFPMAELKDTPHVIHSCTGRYGYDKTILTKLDHGADVHANNDDAVDIALRKGHADTIKLLLDRGAIYHSTPTASTTSGATKPLSWDDLELDPETGTVFIKSSQ